MFDTLTESGFAVLAYLLNLDRSTDRLQHMTEQFARIGYPFERVAGVDGHAFTQNQLSDFGARRPLHTQWSAGLAGCLLSHLKVWRIIAEADGPFAAVFEDDVHFALDMAALLGSTEWIPRDASVVRLESNSRMILKPGRTIAPAPGRRLHEAVSGSWGSAGYIISQRAAESAAAAPESWHHSPDSFLFKPGSTPFAATLRRYQVKPAVCIQDMLLKKSDATMQSLVESEWATLLAKREKPPSLLKRLLPRNRKEPVPFFP
ncbi:MAG: glycosyltransferase family 25 protein [Propylenella sp.]